MKLSSGNSATWWLSCGLAAAAAWILVSRLSLPDDPRYSICIWRHLLDLGCPGCGLTRAFGFLAQGDWARAIQMHPLAPALALEGIILWLLWGKWALRREDGPSSQAIRLWAWMHAFGFVSVWLVRLLTGRLPV